MKDFIKAVCITLALLSVLSVAIACANSDQASEITTSDAITTTKAEVAQTTSVSETTAKEVETTKSPTVTTDDGFGPLIPLVTTKQQ